MARWKLLPQEWVGHGATFIQGATFYLACRGASYALARLTLRR